MSPATEDDNLPSAGGESSATPGPATNVPTQNSRIEDNSITAAETGRGGTEGVPAMPQPPADAASSVQDVDEDEADTPKAITPTAPVPDPLGAAPQGEPQAPSTNGHRDVTQGLSNGLANGRRGSADPLYARRRAGTGSSNPMVESSAARVPTVPIPPELLYRSESAPGVPLLNPVPPPLPTSMSSYQRRLSKENLEQVEKQRAMNREEKRDH